MKLSIYFEIGVFLGASVSVSVEGSTHPNLRYEEADPLMEGNGDMQALPGFMTLNDKDQRKLQAVPLCISSPVKQDAGCMANAAVAAGVVKKPSLRCTSNDVRIASATATSVSVNGIPQTPTNCNGISGLSGLCFTCSEGSMLEVGLTLRMKNGASSVRSDVGLWIGENTTAGAQNGNCSYVVFPDGTLQQSDGDQCTDLGGQADISVNLTSTVTIMCGAVGGSSTSETVTSPYCTSWTVPGADKICPNACLETTSDGIIYSPCEICTAPSSTSKCNCDVTQLNIIIQRCNYAASCKTLAANPPVEGCSATVNDGLPAVKSYSDVFAITNSNCGGGPTLSNSDWSFTGSLCGTSPLTGTRTYTAVPPPNAPSQAPLTCTETVVIRDTTAPVFIDPATKEEECPGCFTSSVENCFTTPTVTDRCGASVTSSTATKTAGTGCSPKTGTYTKTYTARDTCGNTDTTTATVIIKDTTAPTFDNCPSNASINICNVAVPTAASVTASDACSPVTVSGPACCFNGSGIKRTWTAVDSCGKQAQDCVQNIGFTPSCT